MESTLLFQDLLPQINAQIDSAYFGPSVDFGFVLPAPETPIKPTQVTPTLKSRTQEQPSLIRYLLNLLKRSPTKKDATTEENTVSTNTLDIVVPLEAKKRPSWASNVSTFLHRNPRASATPSIQPESPVTRKAYRLENFVPILLVKGVDNSNFSLDGFKFKHVRIDETTIYIGKKKEILLKDCCVRPAMTTSSHQDCLEIIANAAVKGQRGRKNRGTRLVLVLRDFGQLEKWKDEITDLIQSALVTDLLASRVDDDHDEVQEEVSAVAGKVEVASEKGIKTKVPVEEKQKKSPSENDAEPMKEEAMKTRSLGREAVASYFMEAEAAIAKLRAEVQVASSPLALEAAMAEFLSGMCLHYGV